MGMIRQNATRGFSFVLLSYLMWGILPIYWKLMEDIPSMDILCYRIIFSALFMALILFLNKEYSKLFDAFKTWREFISLAGRAFCLAVNWLIYIWGINNHHIIECSLGYFIMPLVVVLLSFVILKERLNILEIISTLTAFIAVLNITLKYDRFPAVALGLAFSFALYAIMKKKSKQGAITGLAAEVMLLTPFTIIYMLFYTRFTSVAYSLPHLGQSVALIFFTGLVTSLPLILYSYGVVRIKMTTVGIFSYIVPTMTFLIGYIIYREYFSRTMLFTFILIWISVIIYIINMLKSQPFKKV